MKKIFIAIIVAVFVGLNLGVIADPPPPPPDPTIAGSNSPVGDSSGAPIGSGITLLISLAGLYGGKKVYDAKRESKKEEN
ncbi:MAG: hypothetical protein WC780_02030 [Lentimicrobiaceae bacterium]|jgi:hypothetical protein